MMYIWQQFITIDETSPSYYNTADIFRL